MTDNQYIISYSFHIRNSNTIISLYRDRADNIWVGTYGGGVNLYTPCSNFFIPHEPEYKLQRSIGNINSMI